MSQTLTELVPSTILITGASRGLGLALARQLAQAGHRLILTARGAEALAQASDELRELKPASEIITLPGDVSQAQHRQALRQPR